MIQRESGHVWSGDERRLAVVGTQPMLVSPGAHSLSVATLVAVSHGEGGSTFKKTLEQPVTKIHATAVLVGYV